MDPVITPATIFVASAPAIAEAVAPKLIEICSRVLSGTTNKIKTGLCGAFSDAIAQNYSKHSYFSSIVFPNKQLKLDDYYIPLTLQSNTNEKEEEIVVAHFPEDLFRRRKDIVVVDSAGMGKSTLLKSIFLKAVETGAGIPVFVELRKIRPRNNTTPAANVVITEIISQLQKNFLDIDANLIFKIIASGDFIFFFDGYDEIEEGIRTAVTQDIIDFKRKANLNRFILSSREMPGLAAFKDFYRYRIKPLSIVEAHNLIKKYSAPNTALAESLIERISKKESMPIHEFLSNPLLVSLLYKAYDFKKNIPLKKHAFYRQVFEALYENHDLSKDDGELNRVKRSGLDMHDFDSAVRVVGYETFYEKKVEYDKDQLLLVLERCRAKLRPKTFSPSMLLDDLTHAVPLFTYDGLNIRWQHKSLQEYFAALYISAADISYQKKVLGGMFKSSAAHSYLNVIGLFIDINPQAARKVIAPLLCDELISIYESNPLISGIPVRFAKIRRSLTMDVTYVICTDMEEDFSLKGNGKSVPKNMVEAEKLIPLDLLSARATYTHSFPATYGNHSERASFLRMLLSIYAGQDHVRFLIEDSRRTIKKKSFKNFPKFLLIDDSFDNLANRPENFELVNSVLSKWSTAVFGHPAINMDEIYILRSELSPGDDSDAEEFKF